jgi:LCP family protein required for cell wall assembly
MDGLRGPKASGIKPADAGRNPAGRNHAGRNPAAAASGGSKQPGDRGGSNPPGGRGGSKQPGGRGGSNPPGRGGSNQPGDGDWWSSPKSSSSSPPTSSSRLPPPRGRLIRRRWPRRTLIGLNVVCALAIMGAGGAYGYVQWRLGQIHRIHVAGLHAPTKGLNVPAFTLLLIGSDSRNIANGNLYGGTADVQGQRSDSIILMRVAPKTHALALLSIPRDTLVPIPGNGTTRINVAFNSGNPSLLSTVLYQDFGIEVNHVAIFNFDTFEAVANAVGGVEQYFPAPAKDAFSLLNIPAAGCTNLSGAQALGFVRSREYQYYLNGQWNYQLYPESDLARIQRQQSFIRDLVHKAKKVAPTNPIALNNIIAGVTKNLTLDSSFSNSLIFSLAEAFKSANVSTIPSYTYPTVNSTAVPGALDPEVQQGQSVIHQWLSVGQQPATPASGPKKPQKKPVLTLTPSSISVSIQNGSGIGGQAAEAGQDLSGQGYHTTVSGDAPTFGQIQNEIEYAPDSLAAAKQVQSQLVGGATLKEDPGLAPTAYNLLLVTGQDYAGVVSPSGAVTSGTTLPSTSTTVGNPAIGGSPAVNPDSSSIYDGVYIPPGLQPGQIPKTCGE